MAVGVGVEVAVGVCVLVAVGVDVEVAVGVRVLVVVGVGVEVAVGVGDMTRRKRTASATVPSVPVAPLITRTIPVVSKSYVPNNTHWPPLMV